MEVELTAFQVKAETELLLLLDIVGVDVLEHSVVIGRMPYSDSPEVVVYVRTLAAKIWLYDDGATYSVIAGNRRYEEEDYSSGDVLLSALLSDLRGDLKRLDTDR